LASEACHAGLVKKDSSSRWRDWIGSKQGYLYKVEAFIERGDEIVIEQNADLEEAISSKDKILGEGAIAQTSGKLSAIIDALQALAPPEGFTEYHAKIVEAYTYKRLANDATLSKALLKIRDYSHKAMSSEIEAMEALRRIYIDHGAPNAIINSIDRNIAAYRQKLVLN
jgi:hypothetical protein